MIVCLQTQIEDLEAEVVARDVQLFAQESELVVVLRERDSAVERLAELQERVRVKVGAQGPTREVMREMRRAQTEIDYWRGLYEQVVPVSQRALNYSQMWQARSERS